jgi:hypothetical protein
VRVAYIILAHTAADQLCRLITRLDGDHARFLIHIDKRSSREFFGQARHALAGNPRITFLRRIATRRTTFGLVAAPMNALSLLASEGQAFDFAILLTGQDYPLKRNDAIVAQLANDPQACFLYTFPIDDPQRSDWPPTEVSRYRDWHFWIGQRHGRIPRGRRIPGGMKPFGGSMYWALPREAVLYLTDIAKREPQFLRFFRHTFAPDEMFVQTMLMNSPLRSRVKTLAAPCCYGLHYIKWSPGHARPETLGSADLPSLRSTPALFARKFDVHTDKNILDAIDSELLGWHPSALL